MKALKKNSALYLEQVASAVAECYKKDEKPCNRALLELYTRIGQCICRQGEKAFIPHLAEMLADQFPSLKGFSLRNLRRMRDFYRTYENNPVLMERAQSLGWTQNAVILECCETDEQRSFYIDLAAERNLSKLALMKAIQEDALAEAMHTENYATNMEPSFAPVSDSRIDEAVDTTASVGTVCEPFVTACEPPRQGNALHRNNDSGYSKILAMLPTGRRMKNMRKQSISCWQDYSFPKRPISSKTSAQEQIIYLKPPPDMVQPKKLPPPFIRKQGRNYQWKVYQTKTAA
ncbi:MULTISPECIES: DUF1016 N-terminal domain-containing protein [Eubacteriales]|uniref:DUF1016 N-terminal domain-containing protein n=1 Tax=Eubacteriales TaxID=186802 RepID=UPI00189914CC|nr:MULTISPECIES: DUF1016 N-terminal domain-containing protein [Eubacteriales]MDF1494584.1 DUF1016 N-terminal domain-containing protein [Caproiciproducens sp. CPB-2]